MAYKIEYDTGKKQYEVYKNHRTALPALIVASFACFVLLTCLLWPEGKAVLQDLVIPGDDALTIQALENMSSNLRNGAGISDAVTAFCREIIHGA